MRKIDSLKIALQTAPTDSLIIEYNWDIGNDYWLYHEDSIDLAKKYTKASLREAQKQNAVIWLVHGYNLLGKIFNLTEELDSAIWSFDQGMEACLDLNDSMRYMMLYDNQANIYVDKGMYVEALLMKQIASDYFQLHADSNTISASYFGLGYIYLTKGDNLPAKNYFYKSMDYVDDWPLLKSEIYGNLAMIYAELDRKDSAEICFRQTAQLSKEIPSIYNLNLYEFALFKEKQQEPDSALFYLEKVLAAEGQGIDLEQYQVMLLDYARMLSQRGRKNEAEKYYKLASKAIEYSQNANFRQKFYESKASVFESLGDFATSLDAYKKFVQLRDSIQDAKNQERFKEVEIKYETEKKEQEIQYLNAEKEIGAIKLQSTKKWVIALTLGLAAAAIFAFFLYWQRKEIKKQRDQINIALEEKDILLREIHHRVKNNLQFISSLLGLQTEHISDEKALGALQEGQDRVQSMALIHQDLYQEDNLTGVDMKNYFTKLIRGLFDSYNIRRDQISLSMEIADLNLDIDSVIPIGLIANELVSNSLKYAFPNHQNGNIYVSLQEENNQLILKVCDDGIGISSKKPASLGTSFGYRLIDVLREQMQGTLKIEEANGTEVILTIRKYQKNPIPTS
ncbi:MAG: sensor histidine kinase [Saprospiraceae bacterium]|nr:sensor histidine kinase [Saprospiraceae bacterium]